MYLIKRRQPSRVQRMGGIEHYTAQTLSTTTLTSEARRRQMNEDVMQDAQTAASTDKDLNLASYSHSTQIQKHLVPQSCVMVILVKDLTRGGAMRAVISGSPSMDPFALLDQLTAGMLMLHQAIRYAPEELTQQQDVSRILRPNQVNVPDFVERRR